MTLALFKEHINIAYSKLHGVLLTYVTQSKTNVFPQIENIQLSSKQKEITIHCQNNTKHKKRKKMLFCKLSYILPEQFEDIKILIRTCKQMARLYNG